DPRLRVRVEASRPGRLPVVGGRQRVHPRARATAGCGARPLHVSVRPVAPPGVLHGARRYLAAEPGQRGPARSAGLPARRRLPFGGIQARSLARRRLVAAPSAGEDGDAGPAALARRRAAGSGVGTGVGGGRGLRVIRPGTDNSEERLRALVDRMLVHVDTSRSNTHQGPATLAHIAPTTGGIGIPNRDRWPSAAAAAVPAITVIVRAMAQVYASPRTYAGRSKSAAHEWHRDAHWTWPVASIPATYVGRKRAGSDTAIRPHLRPRRRREPVVTVNAATPRMLAGYKYARSAIKQGSLDGGLLNSGASPP